MQMNTHICFHRAQYTVSTREGPSFSRIFWGPLFIRLGPFWWYWVACWPALLRGPITHKSKPLTGLIDSPDPGSELSRTPCYAPAQLFLQTLNPWVFWRSWNPPSSSSLEQVSSLEPSQLLKIWEATRRQRMRQTPLRSSINWMP